MSRIKLLSKTADNTPQTFELALLSYQQDPAVLALPVVDEEPESDSVLSAEIENRFDVIDEGYDVLDQIHRVEYEILPSIAEPRASDVAFVREVLRGGAARLGIPEEEIFGVVDPDNPSLVMEDWKDKATSMKNTAVIIVKRIINIILQIITLYADFFTLGSVRKARNQKQLVGFVSNLQNALKYDDDKVVRNDQLEFKPSWGVLFDQFSLGTSHKDIIDNLSEMAELQEALRGFSTGVSGRLDGVGLRAFFTPGDKKAIFLDAPGTVYTPENIKQVAAFLVFVRDALKDIFGKHNKYAKNESGDLVMDTVSGYEVRISNGTGLVAAFEDALKNEGKGGRGIDLSPFNEYAKCKITITREQDKAPEKIQAPSREAFLQSSKNVIEYMKDQAGYDKGWAMNAFSKLVSKDKLLWLQSKWQDVPDYPDKNDIFAIFSKITTTSARLFGESERIQTKLFNEWCEAYISYLKASFVVKKG